MTSHEAPLLAPDSHEPLPTGLGVPASLLVLAGPIIATMISRTVMNFIDFLMVSRLGAEAQAAILPAGMTLFCLISLGMGTLMVVSTFVSQALGRGEPRACSAFTWQGVWLALGLGVASLPLWLGVPGFFAWVGHEPVVASLETDYMQIGLLSVGPQLVGMAVAGFFNGIHRPMVGLWAAIAANVFNVFANLALIFGYFGFPAMGVAGAAWATTLGAVVQAVVLLAWWLAPSFNASFASRSTWRLDVPRLVRTLRVGLPMGLQFTCEMLAFTIFTLFLVGRFGTVQLAAHNIVFKCLEISFMPVAGLSAALTAAVGKAIGRGRPAYARLLTRWALGIALAYMGSVAVCYLLFRTELPLLLSGANDPRAMEAAAWASRLLLICAFFQVFDACGITMVGALRGAGDTLFPAALSFGMSAVLLVGGGFLIAWLRPDLGAVGPWLIAGLYIGIVGSIMGLRWWHGPWEKIDLFAGAEAEPSREG